MGDFTLISMKMRKEKKTFLLTQVVSSFGLLLMGVAVFYYFVCLLPERDEQAFLLKSFNLNKTVTTAVDENSVLDDKQAFVSIVLKEWEIFNNMYDLFMEHDYMVAMADAKDIDSLEYFWRILDLKNFKNVELMGEQLNVLVNECLKNSYCQSSEYGQMGLINLKKIIEAEKKFYAFSADGQVSIGNDLVKIDKSYFADLSEDFIKEAPNFAEMFVDKNFMKNIYLGEKEKNKIIKLNNNNAVLILDFAKLYGTCDKIAEEFHKYMRYQTYCLTQGAEIISSAEKVKNGQYFKENQVCEFEKMFESKDTCARSESYFKYINNLL